MKSNKKIVFLSIPSFNNKGDELMINSLFLFLKVNYPNHIICVPFFIKVPEYYSGISKIPVTLKSKRNLKHSILRKSLKFLNLFLMLIPNKVKTTLKIFSTSDVDLVFDTSGYYLGYHFKVEKINNLVKIYKDLKSKNSKAKLFFLPKSFGPLKMKKTIAFGEEILKYPDYVFARDRISYEEVKALLSNRNTQLKYCPDYTVNFNIDLTENSQKRVVIVPNYRNVERSNLITLNSYVDFLYKCYKYLMDLGLDTVFLIHTQKDEQSIINELIKLDSQIKFKEGLSFFEIKKFIGSSYMVISSRYHGLINGLTQEIPVIGTSWSHKYQELFKEYNIEEFLLSKIQFDELVEKIDLLLDEEIREKYIEKIRKRNVLVKEIVDDMWSSIKIEIHKTN